MADYIAQPDTAVDPDAPVTSDLMYALRDNPIAIAEGAPGAPRIADAALNSTLAGVTSAGSTWVGRRYAAQAATGVGQVVMARYTSTGSGVTITIGMEVNGSELLPASAAAAIGGGALTGRWSCQGYAVSGSTDASVTLWKRLS